MKTPVGFLFLQLVSALCSGEVQSELNSEKQLANQSRELKAGFDYDGIYGEDIHTVLREMTAMLTEQKGEIKQLQKENQGKETKSFKLSNRFFFYSLCFLNIIFSP